MSLFKLTPILGIFITKQSKVKEDTYKKFPQLNKKLMTRKGVMVPNAIEFINDEIEQLKLDKRKDDSCITFELSMSDYNEFDLKNLDTYDLEGELIHNRTENNYIKDFSDKLYELNTKNALSFLDYQFSTTTKVDLFLDIVSKFIEEKLTANERKAVYLKKWLDTNDTISQNNTQEKPLMPSLKNQPSQNQIGLYVYYKAKANIIQDYLDIFYFNDLAKGFNYNSHSSGEKIFNKYKANYHDTHRLYQKVSEKDLHKAIELLEEFPSAKDLAKKDLKKICKE